MIHFYTPNGKPDKLRRPGRKWEPEAYAGPDKMTYCSASGVDLFAMNKQHSKGAGIKEGSQESIEQKLNEVTLHTYLQQVQEYETLLNPLFKIMQSSLGGEPTSKLPSEAGWGPIGEKLPEALEKIDAIPGEWKEQRVEYRRNEAMKLQEIQRKKQLEEEERLLREKERQLLLSQTDGLSEFNQFFDQDGEIMEEQPSQPPPPSSSSSTKKNMRAMPSTMSNKYVTFSPTTSPNKNLLKVSTKDTTSKSSILTSPTKGKSLSIEEKERIEKRKKRVRERSVGAASIPWTLLDELDGEKKKFENEKNYLEFYHKF